MKPIITKKELKDFKEIGIECSDVSDVVQKCANTIDAMLPFAEWISEYSIDPNMERKAKSFLRRFGGK